MSIQRENPQIAVLRERVERRFGKRLSVHTDFIALVDEIEATLKQHISESTLERVWGYSTRGYDTISLRTLDVLCDYAEGCDWHTFCQRLMENTPCESMFFDVEKIVANELKVGTQIKIGWLPDRICIVEYMGSNRFIAKECHNSKMQPGDSFSALQFTLGRELVMSDFCQSNSDARYSYVVGHKSGLTHLSKHER
ncbi:MAG: hypothetical protein IKB15_01565 [Alistipes sp.]|nr:hypothetical protein [Alistipes sp.]